jgi:transposase
MNGILKRYLEQGIKALVTKRHDHGNRYMTREEETKFLEAFTARGEAGQIIEVTEIYHAYQEAVGHPVTRNAIYYMLHKHGWRKVMPRGKHPKKASEVEIAEYKKNLVQDPKGNPKAGKPTLDVSGRSWVWTDQ